MPFLPDLIVRSRRVVTPTATRPASVHIRGGKVVGVLAFDDVPSGCPLDDAGDAAVLPGVVDTNVHVNQSDPGDSDAFETTTRAAASGGMTTVIVRSMSSVGATTSAAAVRRTAERAGTKCYVDIGLWGSVVPGNEAELSPMLEAGVFGFECSLVARGAGYLPAVSQADLHVAMPAIARLAVPLLVHAELPGPIEAALGRQRAARGLLERFSLSRRSRRQYRSYLESRPKEAENEAVSVMIELCRQFRTSIHFLHLSSSDALTPLYHARSARLQITAETCPHYLSFVAEEIPDGATEFTCAPPIRARENREFLWAALAGGLLQMVVSDHSPPPQAHSRGTRDFTRAWQGISSLELSLSAAWTAAAARQYTLNQVTDWMCRLPARLAGLDRKGAIEPGYDADLIVFDPDAEFTVEAAMLQPRHTHSPYVGRRLRGVVHRSYLRGARVYGRDQPIEKPLGHVIVRTPQSSVRTP